MNERVTWQGGFKTKSSFDFGKQYMCNIISLHSVYELTVLQVFDIHKAQDAQKMLEKLKGN